MVSVLISYSILHSQYLLVLNVILTFFWRMPFKICSQAECFTAEWLSPLHSHCPTIFLAATQVLHSSVNSSLQNKQCSDKLTQVFTVCYVMSPEKSDEKVAHVSLVERSCKSTAQICLLFEFQHSHASEIMQAR